MKPELNRLHRELCSVVIFRNITKNGVVSKLKDFLSACENGASEFEKNEYYADFASELYSYGCDLGLYLEDALRCDDNPYVRAVANNQHVPEAMKKCFDRETKLFSELSQLTVENLAEYAGLEADVLPPFESTEKDVSLIMDNTLKNSSKNGYGIYARYGMFRVGESAQLLPVLSPDTVSLSKLIGYTEERKQVLDNTRALLCGKPAANVLLVGDAGTGKSSTVKAVANELRCDGIRLIEIRKDQLTMLPDIMGQIAVNPLKFIIFVDDLSFASEDDGFAALKAILEGSAAAKTPNAVIYATSNRRHIVRETFSAREGDEVHLRDSLEEMMSLSARFGLTVLFQKPGKDLYLQIVFALASENGIEYDNEKLKIDAEAFALRKGGRSARVAEQFVNSLLSR